MGAVAEGGYVVVATVGEGHIFASSLEVEVFPDFLATAGDGSEPEAGAGSPEAVGDSS